MMKKVISLVLCLIMVLSVLVGCGKKDSSDKGAYVTMYLTDPVYNFDPARAYENEASLKIVSLLFEPLFRLDDNGKVKKALVKNYKIDKEENSMTLTLNETSWSDGTPVSANDVLATWRRLLDSSNSFEAAALLYDIKNAREAKEGNVSIDDVQISGTDYEVVIHFNEGVDYDNFLLNLTSYALAPLRENILNQTYSPYDWAKSPAIFYSSGPFKIRSMSYDADDAGMVLERNSYYYRDSEQKLTKSVTPYQIIVDYTKTDEQILADYQAGNIYYIGDIPLSIRGQISKPEVTDALSTHTYVLNQNAVVQYYKQSAFSGLTSKWVTYKDDLVEGKDGEKIFAIPEVRKALSLAIDREAIANTVVFAKAASGLVPYGIFDVDSDKDLFREVGGSIIATGAKLEEAKGLLSTAGVDPAKFMFAISVGAYDEVHMAIAEKVAQAWTALGFHVAVNAIAPVDNPGDKELDREVIKKLGLTDEQLHIDKTTGEDIGKIYDDLFAEAYDQGRFQVAAIDYTAYSASAFSMLAPFAVGYTGLASATKTDFIIPTHRSGYNSEEYNTLIENAFKEKDLKKRAAILHQAEQKLIDDMVVIPIVFNQNATVANKNISKFDFTYYGTPNFAKLKLKNYQKTALYQQMINS